jgi:hypothetical protein
MHSSYPRGLSRDGVPRHRRGAPLRHAFCGCAGDSVFPGSMNYTTYYGSYEDHLQGLSAPVLMV